MFGIFAAVHGHDITQVTIPSECMCVLIVTRIYHQGLSCTFLARFLSNGRAAQSIHGKVLFTTIESNFRLSFYYFTMRWKGADRSAYINFGRRFTLRLTLRLTSETFRAHN